MTDYFARCGHTAMESANPAEFVLDLVCPPPKEEAIVDKLLDAWRNAPVHTVVPKVSISTYLLICICIYLHTYTYCCDGGNTFTPERYRLELNSAHTFTGRQAPSDPHTVSGVFF